MRNRDNFEPEEDGTHEYTTRNKSGGLVCEKSGNRESIKLTSGTPFDLQCWDGGDLAILRDYLKTSEAQEIVIDLEGLLFLPSGTFDTFVGACSNGARRVFLKNSSKIKGIEVWLRLFTKGVPVEPESEEDIVELYDNKNSGNEYEPIATVVERRRIPEETKKIKAANPMTEADVLLTQIEGLRNNTKQNVNEEVNGHEEIEEPKKETRKRVRKTLNKKSPKKEGK